MAEKVISEVEFHEDLHKAIDKPVKTFRMRWDPVRKRRRRVSNGAHVLPWASATVNPVARLVTTQVFLNFKQNSVTNTQYEKLKNLACRGIARYWSRSITVSGVSFRHQVHAAHRSSGAIDVDLSVETDISKYGRSMNPAILGIDASFIYNSGALHSSQVDQDFELVAAHEFGHSVLMAAGGIGLSWGHKGSTHVLTQSVKAKTPGYPAGEIDLMKYFDWDKQRATFSRRISDTRAMEIDIKRLIWGSKFQWVE